jgi:tetratricopeptide (TPR) repeat protein
MRATLDVRLSALLTDMARARELTEHAEYDEARQTYLKLRTQCAKAGIRSAHVAWGLAVACDGLNDFEHAVTYIREAIELDPLAIPYQRSFDVIVERMRKVLGDEARAVDDPTTPVIYELLLRAGEGDAKSHLAMVRWHQHRGEFAPAMTILNALTTLSPSCRQAWLLMAAIARGLGESATAMRADIEAAALEGHDAGAFHGANAARG